MQAFVHVTAHLCWHTGVKGSMAEQAHLESYRMFGTCWCAGEAAARQDRPSRRSSLGCLPSIPQGKCTFTFMMLAGLLACQGQGSQQTSDIWSQTRQACPLLSLPDMM